MPKLTSRRLCDFYILLVCIVALFQRTSAAVASTPSVKKQTAVAQPPAKTNKRKKDSAPMRSYDFEEQDAEEEPTVKKRTIKAPPPRDLPEDRPSHSPTRPHSPIKYKSAIPEPLKFCQSILKELLSQKHSDYAWPFYHPVDVRDLGLDDYFDIIKHPIDLSTIKSKLDDRQYKNVLEFSADLRLMFTNCYRYNAADHDVHKFGKKLQVKLTFISYSASCSITLYVIGGV